MHVVGGEGKGLRMLLSFISLLHSYQKHSQTCGYTCISKIILAVCSGPQKGSSGCSQISYCWGGKCPSPNSLFTPFITSSCHFQQVRWLCPHFLRPIGGVVFLVTLLYVCFLISAPSLGVYYFCRWLCLVCVFVRPSQTLLLLFRFSMGSSHFLVISSPWQKLQNVVVRFLM